MSSTAKHVISSRTRTVVERGITLPFTIPAIEPAYPGSRVFRAERSGETFITIDELYSIVDETTYDGAERYGTYVNLSDEDGYALEAAGFVRRTTGHSWSGTTALYNWGRENKCW